MNCYYGSSGTCFTNDPSNVNIVTYSTTTTEESTTDTSVIFILDETNTNSKTLSDVKSFNDAISWLENDSSVLDVVIMFSVIILIFICCLLGCYCFQSHKTKKLKETLFNYDPELLTSIREANSFKDVVFVDGKDMDDSSSDDAPGVIIAQLMITALFLSFY